MLILYINFEPSAYTNLGPHFARPILPFSYLPFFNLTTHLVLMLSIAWKLSLILCSIGLFWRQASITAFALGYCLLGLENQFRVICHHHNLNALALFVFCFSRAGNYYSIDKHLKSLKSFEINKDYTIFFIQLIWAIAFFFAGFRKTSTSGLEWISHENLTNTAIYTRYLYPMSIQSKGELIFQSVRIQRKRKLKK